MLLKSLKQPNDKKQLKDKKYSEQKKVFSISQLSCWDKGDVDHTQKHKVYNVCEMNNTNLIKVICSVPFTLDTRLALYAAKAFRYSFLAASVFFL
jgi:hypothetical protein